MKLYLIVITLFSTLLSAEQALILSEKSIKEAISQSPPSMEQIESSFYQAKQAYLSQKDQFGLRLDGQGQIYKSKERLLNNFDGGVIKNSTSYSASLVQPTKYGVDMSLSAFGSKATNAFVNDAATNGLTFNLSVDLMKNFLGRTTNNSIKKSLKGFERAGWEQKISKKTFESNLRKIYWALVANNEKKLLLTSLKSLAQNQYDQVRRKSRSGVADSGEVARSRSQLAVRTSDLLALNYEKIELLKSLKQLLPNYNGHKIKLNSYNIDNTITSLLICTTTIESHKKPPLQYTFYDEIASSLNEEEVLDKKIINTYDDPQIKLVGEYSSVGRDYGLEGAREDFFDNSKPRSSLALQISIPLDGKKRKTRKAKAKMAERRYKAQSSQNLLKVKAYHSETIELINTLKEILLSQKDTNKYLKQSLRVSLKKYNQGRINLQQLINERDSHLKSKLSEINSNLTIVNTIIDYFSIFTDFPCEFNRI